MVESPSDRPTVCVSRRSTATAACGGFAAEHRRLLDGARLQLAAHKAPAGARLQLRRSTALSSKCEQCRVDSRRGKLSTDLFSRRD